MVSSLIFVVVNNDWQRLYLYEYDEFNQLITSCDYINQKQYRYDYDEAGNIPVSYTHLDVYKRQQ